MILDLFSPPMLCKSWTLCLHGIRLETGAGDGIWYGAHLYIF